MAEVAVATDGSVAAVVFECGCVVLAAVRYQRNTLAYWNIETTKYFLVVCTKSNRMKNILLLSARLGETKDDGKCKPTWLKFYDFSKGVTGIIYRIMTFSVYTKSKLWTISAFSYTLDTIRVNSQIIFAMSKTIDPRKLKHFAFAFELVRQLST